MLSKIEKLKTHPFYKNYFKKLKKEDLIYMQNFINEISELSVDEKEKAVYRSAMRVNKPKNWAIVEELISIAIKE